MASSIDLQFGSFGTIADINSIASSPDRGDIYNRTDGGIRPKLDVRRVTFPGTKGAELRVIGNQQTSANSLVIRYGVSHGRPSCIFKAEDGMQTFLESIDTFRLNEDNLTGTLTDTYNQSGLTGMYWSSFTSSPIKLVQINGTWMERIFFQAVFERITPP